MQLSRPMKVCIGLLTVWPILYMGVFFLFVFSNFFLASTNQGGPGLMNSFGLLFGLHCCTMLLILGLMVFYVVHIVKATFEKTEMKIIWLILVLLGGMIAMPVYWYLYIWRETAGPGLK